MTAARVKDLRRERDVAAVRIESASGTVEEQFDCVLCAVGIVGNVEGPRFGGGRRAGGPGPGRCRLALPNRCQGALGHRRCRRTSLARPQGRIARGNPGGGGCGWSRSAPAGQFRRAGVHVLPSADRFRRANGSGGSGGGPRYPARKIPADWEWQGDRLWGYGRIRENGIRRGVPASS